MRILRLTFQNINSLKGKFDINFETSPLGDAGLFVITGPTGAGKTSILDAVCVALYGKTPRLPNKKELEQLMTHHTGECRAEVTFAVNGKIYRSYYERYRARRKPEGNFQPPKMELVDEDANTIIADKVSQVPSAVEELTGLDYVRFARSIMLAQGNFTAFLQAAEDERAVLLEKMTGTEIYTDISKSVFNRDKSEKQKLETLNAVLENVNLMSGDAVREKKEKLLTICDRIDDMDKILFKIAHEKKYLQDIEEFKAAIAEGEEKLRRIDEEVKLAAPDFIRLESDLKTMPLKASHAVLQHFRNQEDTLEKKIAETKKNIPGVKADLEKIRQNKEAESRAFAEFKMEKETLQGLITETVKQDGLIKKEKDILNTQAAKLDAIKKHLADIEKKKKRTETSIAKMETEIESGQKFILQHEADKDLENHLSLVFEKFADIKELSELKTAKQNRIVSCRKEIKKARKNHDKTQENLKQTESKLSEKNRKKEALSGKLIALLAGKDQAFWEEKADGLKKHKQEIERIQDKGRQVVKVDEKLKVQKALDKSLDEKLSTAEQSKTNLVLKNEEKEKAIKSLEKAKELEDAIKSLEERRQELMENAPCPLCGSTDHPWAQHAPETGNTVYRLNACQKELKDIHKELKKVEKSITESSTEKKLNEKAMDEGFKGLDKITAEYRLLTESVKLEVPPDQWKSLDHDLETVSGDLLQTTAALKEIKMTNEALAELAEQIVATTKKHTDDRVKCEKAEHNKRSLEEKEDRLTKEARDLNGRFEKTISDLNSIIDPYDEKITDVKDGDKHLDRLKRRSDLFQKQEKLLKEISEAIGPVREKLAADRATVDNDAKQLELEKKNFKTIENNLKILADTRKSLFGEKNPEMVQKKLRQKTLDFEKNIKDFDSSLTEMKKQLAARQETLAQNSSDLEIAQKKVIAASGTFNSKLEATGFLDEQDFLAAFLPKDEQKQLIDKKEDLEKRKIENLSLIKNSRDKLEKALKHPVTGENLEAVVAREATAEKQKTDLFAEKGAISVLLEENEKRVRDHMEKVKEASIQAKECGRWSTLNDLIGAADGAKFRKFAQGLTLETLMENANIYLDMLSRRYVLKRSELSDLAIEVIDTFYGDQIRPTDNLSGGESFLISLALALGLSDLSSRRTTIESLFLDEGFGTLDAQTLETALGALDTLNASGKTIGIISHVEALKERIPAKIEVKPVSGGVSTIEVI